MCWWDVKEYWLPFSVGQNEKKGKERKEAAGYIYGDRRVTTNGCPPNCRLNRCSSGAGHAADSSLVIDLCVVCFFPEKQRKKKTDKETNQPVKSRQQSNEYHLSPLLLTGLGIYFCCYRHRFGFTSCAKHLFLCYVCDITFFLLA